MPTALTTHCHWLELSLGVFFPAIAVLICAAGCGRTPIETPDELILYSIDGRGDRYASTAEDHFHGYPVLGKLDVQDPADRRKIVAALYEGINSSDGSRAKCFWPRHGIHAVTKGKSVDYVICFECLQLEVVDDTGSTNQATTRAPQAVFNAFLTKARIAIAAGVHD